MGNELICAPFEKLLEDDIATINHYFFKAITAIDNEFGKGYAKLNPDLVAAYIQAAASCGQASILGKVFEYSLTRYLDSMEKVD